MNLPIEINNKKTKNNKKKMVLKILIKNYKILLLKKKKNVIGDFKMDNLKNEKRFKYFRPYFKKVICQ